jgi:hypothetical protein
MQHQRLQELTLSVTQGKDEHDPSYMWMWRVEFIVIRTSRASQVRWPNPVIWATWETETRRMVVWGELEQNGSENQSQQISRAWSVPIIPVKRACCIKSKEALSSNASNAKKCLL